MLLYLTTPFPRFTDANDLTHLRQSLRAKAESALIVDWAASELCLAALTNHKGEKGVIIA